MVLVGFEGVQPLDLVGPFEVFTGATLCLAGQGRPDDGYDVTIGAVDGQSVSTGTGLEIVAKPLPDPRQTVDTVVLPGGFGIEAARLDQDLIGWIQAVSENARRVVSVCTGAFLAAQAGLLDGCRATTHWAFANQMTAEFPSVTVDPDPIFMRSAPKVWTAAGVTAGIDLALSLVEDDYGTDVAQTVARWLVLYLRRTGRPDAVLRAGVDAKGQTCADPHGAGGHRVRTRWAAQRFRSRSSCGHEPAPFHSGLHR